MRWKRGKNLNPLSPLLPTPCQTELHAPIAQAHSEFGRVAQKGLRQDLEKGLCVARWA